ncbi:MAG TPA: hypothetical protein VGA56_26950, partial [Opitutaceae bacterium]
GRAATQNVSVEETHRRLLRTTLIGDQTEPQRDFITYLHSIPQDDSIEFTREKDLPRRDVNL